MSEVTSLISLLFFGLFVIFGIISHIRKSGWAIGLFSLAGICLVVFILMGIGQLMNTTSDGSNDPVPDQTDVVEEKLEDVKTLQSKMTVGLSLEEYEKLSEEVSADQIKNFIIPDGTKGNVWEGSDGYLVVIIDQEKIVKNARFKSMEEVQSFEDEIIALAEQENEESPDDSGSNENTEDSGEDSEGKDEPEKDYILYKVVRGDTLWSIAQRAEITVEAIMNWNDLESNDIYVGQSLKIYGKDPGPPPPPKTTEPDDPKPAPSVIISNGNLQRKQIAFTFDAGSDIAGIQILDVLKKHNLKSTFFLTGKWVEKFPDYAKQIASSGHEIASHSYGHPDFTKISRAEIIQDLSRAEKAINDATGINPQPYFRFPYGAYNSQALVSVGEAGYSYSIHWSLDTIDWQQPSAEVIIDRIMNGASNGDIVLMHIGGIHTPEAVDAVIPRLKEKGYEIVTLSQVLK